MDLSTVAKKLKDKKVPEESGPKMEMQAEAPKQEAEQPKEKSAWQWSDANTRQALIQGIPLLLGAAVGGNEGAAMGADLGAKTYKGYANELKAEDARASDADKTKFMRDMEMDKLDLAKQKQSSQEDYWDKDLSIKARAQLNKERGGVDKNTYDYKLSKLGGEDKKKFGLIRVGKGSIQEMAGALKGGDNTFTMVGSNDYTIARDRFTQAVGRLFSGAVIGEKEAEQFYNLVPTATDSKEMQVKKLGEMSKMMDTVLSGYNFDPNEIPDYVDPSFQTNLDAYHSLEAPMGMNQAVAAPVHRAVNTMSIDEMKQELGRR